MQIQEWKNKLKDDSIACCGGDFCFEGHNDRLETFFNSLLHAQADLLREKIESLKGWDHCIRHEIHRNDCLVCARLEAVNLTIHDVLHLFGECTEDKQKDPTSPPDEK